MSRPARVLLAYVAALASNAGAMAQQPPMRPASEMRPANDSRPFTKAAFDAAAAEGRTILVDFYAPWCPVCRAQEPKITARLNGDFRHVVSFRVDYDSNQALRQEMRVQKQSTLILFQGRTEAARLSYTSDDAAIDELFAHAKRP